MTTPKFKRRWYQFSLRTLLIVVTLSAVPMGWVGWKLAQGRRQRDTVAWVENLGGGVEYEEWVGKWSGVVSSVDLRNTQVSDISPLAELNNLERLYLGITQVSDVSPLAELKSLRELSLSNTQVSDLSPLAELKSLNELWLRGTQVSDLSPLAELKNLEELDLSDTQVSDEQVQKLQRALPNCDIRWSVMKND